MLGLSQRGTVKKGKSEYGRRKGKGKGKEEEGREREGERKERLIYNKIKKIVDF